MMNDSSMTDNTPPDTSTPVPVSGLLSPKPGRWQRFLAFPITRIVLYLLLFAFLALVPSLALPDVLHLLHHQPGHDRMLIGLISEMLYVPSPILAFWIMTHFADHRPWETSGFTRRGLTGGLLSGFVVGAVMLTAGIAVYWVLGSYHVVAVTLRGFLFLPLLLYLGVAVTEEAVFRGYLLQTLEDRWGSGVALTATSLLFGLAHLANPVPGASHWMRVAGPLQICFEAGLPMGAAYLLTRRLWLPIGIHWAWDYFEGPVYGCPDSGSHDPHTLLHATFSGPAVLTGGPFGPEAGFVFLAVGTLTGMFLLRAAIRKGQWKPRPIRRA